ncbi:PAS domain S-box protein [Nocardioides sp. URHA0020]|uniref:PAS domain S-box protein n=1 Tax=Nocardioides sp. URHA0020 TaxID=1380392 RepID=UPI000686E428|nr:PAS domain S-box protein [Nocardioides sp. URHA0020]
MAAGGETTTRPTIVVVDDAAEVRALVRTRLRLSGLLDVVGEAGNGAEAVEVAGELQPALVLLDVSMPVMDGLEALPRILEVSPGSRVVMYSGFQEEGLAHRAAELGASAFLEKSTALDTLAAELVQLLDPQASPPPVSPAAPPEAEDGERRVLREHLERFREVFEDAAIGMATVTLAGRIVRANRSLAAIVGRSVDELVGTSYAAFAGASRGALDTLLRGILTGTEEIGQLEHEVTGATGRRRVVATFAPVLDSSRRPLYLFVQVQDVTVQRAAEEELRRSEVRFRLLVDNVDDYAILMLSPEGLVESWNAGAQRIKGYAEDEIVGRHFSTFYPPEVRESGHPERELELALRDGHYEEEGWRIRKDGSRFWATVLITAVRDRDGRHVGFAKVTRDVTRRREQEEALRASEERFRLLVETVSDYAIFMLSPQGLVASWNAGAQRLKGFAADEIIGRHFRTFYPTELQESRHPEDELELALRDGRYEEEGWRIRKDGTRFWANVIITAVHDSQGRHVGFAKVTRDITERRLMLEEQERTAAALTEANARLQQAADDQTHFLAVTAHELRTPVAVLGGTADMLVAHWPELDDVEREELLLGMGSSATRLRRLLDDLLTASRLQSSRLELGHERVDVARVVVESVAAARRTHPGVVIEADVDGADLAVVGDAGRLGQALDNLIGNALVHGAGPVTVTAGEDGPDVVVTVQDSGAGVPPEMRDRLFERFSTGRARGGTGLGLFIVRQLARAHGGDATYRPPVADVPGAFVVRLARAGATAPDDAT